MSDDATKDPIHAQIEHDALREKKRKEVQEKELLIRDRKANSVLEKIHQNDKDIATAKNINYGALSDEEVEAKQKENSDYMGAAKNKLPFICDAFDKAVPFFRKNLILVGAPTGSGKSTTVANIIYSLLRARKKNGDRYRILVLTNEEKSEDVYNRVTCLFNGWNYTNHDKFSEDQVKEFNKYIVGLSKNGTLTVIDDQYGGALGTTTSVEGISQVFDNLIERQDYYDVVVLDYYQNVTESKQNIGMNEWEVQATLARRLDRYKNIYPAPIVVLAQVREKDKDDKTPFKIRIEGRKTILNVCTCALEIIAKPADRCTEWVVHKSRFNEAMGKKIETGYDSGKYVLYNAEFKEKVNKWKASIEKSELDKNIGMPDVMEDEEDVVQEKASGDRR